MESNDKTTLLFDGRLIAGIPDSFQPMEEEKAAMMFPCEERPQLIFEDSGASRFCTFSLLKRQSLTGTQVKRAVHSIADAVTSLYPTCLLKEPGLVRVEGGTWGWFAFRTATRERDLYNVMYVRSVAGEMMLGTLGCPLDDDEGRIELMRIPGSLKSLEEHPSRAKICIELHGHRSENGGGSV